MTLLGVGVGGGNVAGFQVTAEADGELVTRAEDLDAGVTQPQGIADRRRPEVGESGRSRAQKRGGRVGDDLIDETGAQECGREGRASFEEDVADLALGEHGEDGARVSRFLQRRGLALDNVLLDSKGEVGRHFGLRALPATLFYGRDGSLQDIRIGALSKATLQERIERLRR